MLASVGLARLSRMMLFALFFTACTAATLVGTDLGTQQAPDFTLTDGLSAATVRLSDLRQNVVALAFLYTRCPDVCPLTAEEFRHAQEKLGGDAAKVRFVAVSVDPEHDTPAAVRSFSEAHRLDRNWHYLIGPASALRSVWSAYAVDQADDPSGAGLTHSDAIYLIDAKGRARVLLHSDAGADTIAKDLRILVRE